jgi:hypothetical protein
MILLSKLLAGFAPRRGSSPHRHQPVRRHLEFRSAPLDRGGLVGRLDGSQPHGFAGDLVDAPDDRLRRFGLLGHAASIGRQLCRFNPVEGEQGRGGAHAPLVATGKGRPTSLALTLTRTNPPALNLVDPLSAQG